MHNRSACRHADRTLQWTTPTRIRSSRAKAGRFSRSPIVAAAGALVGRTVVLRCPGVVRRAVHRPVLPRSAAQRAARARCRAFAGGREDRQHREDARSVSRPRRAQDQRVHERVQRAFQSQPRRRHGRGRVVPRRQLRQRRARQGVARERAQRVAPADRGGSRRHLRPDRGADRAPDPLLREARRDARPRPALRLHPLRIARRRLPRAGCAAQGRRRRHRVRDRNGASPSSRPADRPSRAPPRQGP